MSKKLTTEEFIEKAKAIHGNRYDYSLVEYITNKDKVKIICKEHGIFEQRAIKHLCGQGCGECKGSSISKSKIKRTAGTFEIRAKQTHGDKYNYDSVVFKGMRHKVKILCKKHNIYFLQTPDSHIRGANCKKCGIDSRLLIILNRTKLKFILKAKQTHNNTYNYSKSKYLNGHTIVEIYCKKHNHYFKQFPQNHIKGAKCPKCVNEINPCRSTVEDFITKAKIVHTDMYKYNKVVYINAKTNVKIYCMQCKVYFKQVPSNHLVGKGCPNCAEHGFNYGKPAILYYLSILNGTAYKIGITNRSIKERFTVQELLKIKILKTTFYQYGNEAFDAEQKILKEFKYAKYKGDNLLESGNTELFKYDILGLD